MNLQQQVRGGIFIALKFVVLAMSLSCSPENWHESPIIWGTPSNRTAVGILGGASPADLTCSASLIAPQLVLTAAHCFRDSSLADATTSMKYWTVDSETGFVYSSDISSYANLARDYHFDRRGRDDDIALVFLAQPVSSGLANPLAIATGDPPNGNTVTTIGWGYTENPDDPQMQRSRDWLWGDKVNATCNGDSGGPTLDDSGAIVRVTSAGSTKDCLSSFDIFANPITLRDIADFYESGSDQPPSSCADGDLVHQGKYVLECRDGAWWLARGGIEQLFIASDSGDLYLRTSYFVAKLDIRDQLSPPGSTITGLVWGNDGASFMARVATGWAIFELSPRPVAHVTWTEPPTAILVRQEVGVTLSYPDQILSWALDSNRDILYAGLRGIDPDPFNYQAAVLVNSTRGVDLRNYGMALQGEFGGGSEPFIIYADGADLASSVVYVASWAYLDWDVWGYTPVPGRESVWVGDTEHIIFDDPFGSKTVHQGWDDWSWWAVQRSTRRHVMFTINMPTDEGGVYLYDVPSGGLKKVFFDEGTMFGEEFAASPHTGVDRLYSGIRDAFLVAWNPETGDPTLDAMDPAYPPIDTAAADLAILARIPPEVTMSTVRALQIIDAPE